jgi:hypothetical protein
VTTPEQKQLVAAHQRIAELTKALEEIAERQLKLEVVAEAARGVIDYLAPIAEGSAPDELYQAVRTLDGET